MPRKFWWPTALNDQYMLVLNFLLKFPAYAAGLGFSPAQITAAEALCNAIVGAIQSTEQCKTTMQAMTQWRDEVLYGETSSSVLTPQAPVFPVVGTTTYPAGSVTEFMRLRDQIVASSTYTRAIGEDLGLVGAETTKPAPDTLMPDVSAKTSTGYWVNLSGSMRGMDALRVEYSRDGGESFQTVAFLTNTPSGFQITPQDASKPEKGLIRAIYIRKSEPVGTYSDMCPVTLS